MEEVTVFTTDDGMIADMAVDILKKEGITAHKIETWQRSVFKLTFDGMGVVQVRVPGEESERAREIIAARFPDGTEAEQDDVSQK